MGLFVLTLAVCLWGLHYRLEQYQSTQLAGRPILMAKMWLGDRGHTAATTVVQPEQAPVFAAVFAFFGLFLSIALQPFLKAFQTIGQQNERQWIHPPLWTHGHALFFRPPPVLVRL